MSLIKHHTKTLTLRPPITTKVPYANSLELNKTTSYSASYLYLDDFNKHYTGSVTVCQDHPKSSLHLAEYLSQVYLSVSVHFP